jgi:GNAT superfamily N-acetyltransferase
MEIRRAGNKDLDQVVEILNKVAENLQQKGIYQWAYPWDRNEIEQEIKKDQSFTLLIDEKVIGIFFIGKIDRLSDLIIAPQSNYLNKIAILPEYQGNNFGAAIIEYACCFARQMNKTLYLDCWAGNDKLRAFYSRHGFNYVGDFPEDDYYISVFEHKEKLGEAKSVDAG